MHLVEEIAINGIELYGKDGHRWPCGSNQSSPGLMLGLSGIGYFYLRLHNPSIPSILLIN
jgi:lantibiotic modifying enzyme